MRQEGRYEGVVPQQPSEENTARSRTTEMSAAEKSGAKKRPEGKGRNRKISEGTDIIRQDIHLCIYLERERVCAGVQGGAEGERILSRLWEPNVEPDVGFDLMTLKTVT